MITPDELRAFEQEHELLVVRVERLEQQQIVLDERQRREMSSLTRAFLLSDQSAAEARRKLEYIERAGALQDQKLVQAETLLNEVRVWIKTAVGVVTGGFVVVVILLFVIALQR